MGINGIEMGERTWPWSELEDVSINKGAATVALPGADLDFPSYSVFRDFLRMVDKHRAAAASLAARKTSEGYRTQAESLLAVIRADMPAEQRIRVAEEFDADSQQAFVEATTPKVQSELQSMLAGG